ncbi:MAG TPA: DnaB-like helicase C-terminal domain-containing protein [Candidatus Limnocylindrales bacterium]|nr:DnaB-like helicase C-terminal domain-containing protein [Candidatus Limnocylindrales bacterium]
MSTQWDRPAGQSVFGGGAPDDAAGQHAASDGLAGGPGMRAPLPPAGSAPAALPAAGHGLEWELEIDGQQLRPRSALDVLTGLDETVTSGRIGDYQPIGLGMTPLDKALGGGIRGGELILIGGAQGTGKTTLSLQIARNIALGGQANVLYICFEHDDEYLLNRLIALESAIDSLPTPNGAIKLNDVRREILATWMAQGAGQAADLAGNPRLRVPLERIGRYGQSLFMMRGSQTLSTIDNMRRLVEAHRRAAPDRPLVLFVDYLQKVPVMPDPPNETERVTAVVNGLKDIALTQGVAVVSIVAADKEGLKASRLRNHHLRGSSAINYEADVILILNEKYNIVAKVNIEFNPYQAQRFRDWIVLTVEKNRSGQHSIDLEFQKHFAHACFDPTGRAVQEKLIEERLYND